MRSSRFRYDLMRSAAIVLPTMFAGGTGALADSLNYINIPFSAAEMNFTGIRGNSIVGNYIIPNGGGASGGELYSLDTRTWVPITTYTSNGVNYPGATTQLPYGPTFGSAGGILRLVGSYKTAASTSNIGYLYDAAAAPGAQYTNIYYPSSSGSTVINTIPHSQFGNYAVGNYDTSEGSAGAFIYNIKTQTYTNLSGPGATVTTAYGIYGDKIVGGYTTSAGLNAQHGMFYDMSTGVFTTYDHPGSITTHFQGVTGGGRHGEYNLAADWLDDAGNSHASILHINADGTYFWRDLDVPGSSVTSIDSIYAGNAVGFYFLNGEMQNYFVTVPGVYDPIRNTGSLAVTAANAVGISGISGDDIVNDGTITVSGANAVGVSVGKYGVVANNGTIAATGQGASAVQLRDLDSTLLNAGTITAAPGAFAISTDATADGTIVVNTGIIDGVIAFNAGPDGRFENSGWLGISAAGAGAVHQIDGVFAQTPTGTLAVRVDGASNDSLNVAGAARLNGTLAASFASPTALQRTYTVITASEGVTGTFASLTTTGLPSFINAGVSYAPTSVALNLTSDIAGTGTTTNQQSVGAALDSVINSGTGSSLTSLPSSLSSFYSLAASELPSVLASLSGEGYASEQTVIIGDGAYSRNALMGRLRQGAYAGESGALAALAFGGPELAYATAAGTKTKAAAATETLATGDKPADPAAANPAAFSAITLWAQGLGSWTNYNSSGNAAGVDESIGGVISGADAAIGDWRVGGALGYTQSNASLNGVSSSSDVDSFLLALYAGGKAGPLNLRLGATYAFNQIDTDRTVAFGSYSSQPSSQYNGGTTQVFGEVSYGIAVKSVALEPYAGLAWVHLNTDSFSETGGGAVSLSGASQTADVGYSTLGLRVASTFALSNGMSLAPHLSAAWQYGFGDLSPTAQMNFTNLSSASFNVSGVPLAKNTALLDAGIDLQVSPQARVGLSYVGQYAGSATSNGFQANVSFRF